MSSKDKKEQLFAYQQGITSLYIKENVWQKFDYLMEFAEWLYINKFSSQDVVDMIEWAADFLTNIKTEKKKVRKGKTKKPVEE